MSERRKFLLLLGMVAAVTGVTADLALGEILINKAKMREKTAPNNEVSVGTADAAIEVDFKGNASCDCCEPDLKYTWYFGDGDSASEANVSHLFDTPDMAYCTAYLHVECQWCSDAVDSAALTVHVVDGIWIKKIGDISLPDTNGRISCNDVLAVTAEPLPLTVECVNAIDWGLMINGHKMTATNDDDGTLSSLPDNKFWTTNACWGDGLYTLYAFMDESGTTGPAGQDGELRLTGTASLIVCDKPVAVFYNALTSENETAAPNWFYYWSMTLADMGDMGWSGTTSMGGFCNTWDNPNYPCFIDPEGRTPYHTPDVGKNAETNLTFIDTYAWTARHEWAHHTDMDTWWGADGRYATDDGDGGGVGDNIPDHLETSIGTADGGPYHTEDRDTDTSDQLDNDFERHAVFTQADWTVGSQNNKDWSHPGKQWP